MHLLAHRQPGHERGQDTEWPQPHTESIATETVALSPAALTDQVLFKDFIGKGRPLVTS